VQRNGFVCTELVFLIDEQGVGTVNRSVGNESVGRKILFALLVVMLLSVFIPTRGAEVARSADRLLISQAAIADLAAVGHPFVPELGRPAIYSIEAEKELGLDPPVILTYPHRGPPVLS
jgi:hypothetical protein